MPDATPSPTPPTIELSQQEIDSGKTMAVLSYIPIAMIGLIVSIICIAQKNNAFALYHAKQALTLYICAIGAALLCIPLCFVCIGIPMLVAVGIGQLVLLVLGIMNVCNNQCKPLPLIGTFADKWFGKIQKV